MQALDVEFKYQGSDPFAIRDALLSNESLLTKALGFVLCANLFETKPSTGGLRDDRKNKFSESAKRAMTRAAEGFNTLKSEMKTAVTVAGLVNSVPEMAMLSKVLVPSSPSPAMLQLLVREELRVALESDIAKVIDQSELNAMTAAAHCERAG